MLVDRSVDFNTKNRTTECSFIASYIGITTLKRQPAFNDRELGFVQSAKHFEGWWVGMGACDGMGLGKGRGWMEGIFFEVGGIVG